MKTVDGVETKEYNIVELKKLLSIGSDKRILELNFSVDQYQHVTGLIIEVEK